MSEASKYAIDLADAEAIDIADVTGTGKDGLVRKSDVIAHLASQIPGTVVPHPNHDVVTVEVPDVAPSTEIGSGVAPLPDEPAPEPEVEPKFTNIMDAQRHEREKQAEAAKPSIPTGAPQAFTQEQMFAIIQDLQGEVASLKEANAARISRDAYEVDLTDEMLFIAKPNGERWEERQIIDKRTVMIEYIATAFFGPFKDQDMVDGYLKAKLSKREDSYIRWEGISVMTGRDARILQRNEKEAREINLKAETSTNVLDRRIFETQTANAQPTSHNPVSEQEWVAPAGLPSAQQV